MNVRAKRLLNCSAPCGDNCCKRQEALLRGRSATIHLA